MKGVLKVAADIFFSRLLMRLLYARRCLTERSFDSGVNGWQWCWRCWFLQKMVGINRHVLFPVAVSNVIGNPRNLHFSPDDLNIFQHFGCYFQCWHGQIHLGKRTYIAPNVGMITENHDVENLDAHQPAQDIVLGEKCWVGMNAVILPGVVLGDRTVVGAGAVVTRSFPDGHVVLLEVPARLIQEILGDGTAPWWGL